MKSTTMEFHRSAGLRLAEVIGNGALIGMIWLNTSLHDHDGGLTSTLVLLPCALFLFNALIELSYLVRGNPAVVSIVGDVLTVKGPIRTRRYVLSDVSVHSSSRLMWPGSVVNKSANSSVKIGRAHV